MVLPQESEQAGTAVVEGWGCFPPSPPPPLPPTSSYCTLTQHCMEVGRLGHRCLQESGMDYKKIILQVIILNCYT